MKIFGVGYSIFTATWMAIVAIEVVWPMNATEWSAWVGAIFTGLAFAGTIFIATSQQRREDRQRIEKAKVFGPAIAMKLSLAHPAMEVAVWALENPTNAHHKNHQYLGKELEALSLWTDIELEPLICIPGDVAVNLTIVREAVLITANALRNGSDFPSISETVKHLAIACRYAEAAGTQMQKFFDLHSTTI